MPDLVKSISQIFANRIFHVPDYQRGYSWEVKQWNDLLEDLDLLSGQKTHFTGTLVLRQLGDGSSKMLDTKGQAYSSFDIIDGQQRLTTVVVLLKAIYDQMGDLEGFQGLAEGLCETYLNNHDLNNQPFTKLVLNQDFSGLLCQQYPWPSSRDIRTQDPISSPPARCRYVFRGISTKTKGNAKRRFS